MYYIYTYLNVRLPGGHGLVSQDPVEGGGQALAEEALAWLTVDVTSWGRGGMGRGARRSSEQDNTRTEGEQEAEERSCIAMQHAHSFSNTH